MYVTLALVKQHLNIESSYTGDDTYITHLIQVAEKTVEKHIDFHLEDYEDSSHNIPKPLQQAILLYVGDLYNNREVNAYGVSVVEVPFAYQYLLSLYQDYSGLFSEDTEDKMIDEICNHLVIESGSLIIDPAYRHRCLHCGGAKSRAYQRLFQKVMQSAHLDNNGNIILEF